ncbi:MAG: S49 family peptidase [Ferrovibrio sp.]|nr:S49 family peptidase [Ferrovibrio sp.]
MTILQAITAEPWAIMPSYLHVIAALAQRDHASPALREHQEWSRRDGETLLQSMASAVTGRRMEGARYAMVTDQGVAIIPVYGPIFPRANIITEYSGGASAQMLQADYRLALNHNEVEAVLWVFDTPGGAASGVNALADAIHAGAAKKRTEAYVAGAAASAGYWLASQAKRISAERTGMVGSIGVVAAVPKQVEAGNDGVMTVEIVSSNAPNKRPDPTTDDGKQQIRTMLDAIEAQFIADVARGRGVKTERVIEAYGQGGMLIGSDAVAAGMIDKIQSFEACFDEIAQAVSSARRVKKLAR